MSIYKEAPYLYNSSPSNIDIMHNKKVLKILSWLSVSIGSIFFFSFLMSLYRLQGMTSVNYDIGPGLFVWIDGVMFLLAIPSIIWLRKGKTFSKLWDVIFLVIIIALLIPSSYGFALTMLIIFQYFK